MAPKGQMGQMDIKCILEKCFCITMGQDFSGERWGPWASCFKNYSLLRLEIFALSFGMLYGGIHFAQIIA
jgi:hypothetical protein